MATPELSRSFAQVTDVVERTGQLYDPVTELFLEYQVDLEAYHAPTTTEYMQMVGDVKNGREYSAYHLASRGLGLVSAIAYRFGQPVATSDRQLLEAGGKSLVLAAAAFSPRSGIDFEDFAVRTIEAGIANAAGSDDGLIPRVGCRPMEEIYAYARDYTDDPQQRLDRHREILGKLGVIQGQVALLLHLPTEHIMARLDLSYEQVDNAVKGMKDRFSDRPPNTTALALRFQKEGLVYRLQKPDQPMSELLTVRERVLARHLGVDYSELPGLMRASSGSVWSYVYRMKDKTGALGTTGLALMSQEFDTEELPALENPRRERFAAKLGLMSLEEVDMESAKGELTQHQREITDAYLGEEPWEDITQRFGISVNTAQQTLRRAAKTLRSHFQLKNALSSY